MRRVLEGITRDADTSALETWLDIRPEIRTIAAFLALPGEVDLAALIARHPGRRWVFPRVAGDRLGFHEITDPARDLATSAYGVREPLPSLACVEIREIDAFFCPGLAFESNGGRLGRGKGDYDKTLAGARPDALKIGVTFREQRVADTFGEPHDIVMDEVFFC